MASEIRVNKITHTAGVGTITTSADGIVVAGIVTAATVVASGSITGEHHGNGANLTNLPAGNLTGNLPAISAANLTSIPAANITGTLPAISAANLTNVPAANITGTLPAIDGSNLTGVGASFGNSSVNTSGIITATAFVPTSQTALTHRNRIINGAMQIWQRGTTINSQGNGQNDYTADRWAIGHNNSHMAAVSQSNGTDAGFEYCARVQRDSGNSQTDQMRFHTALEAKDVIPLRGHFLTLSYFARKGADYSEANSKITGVRIASGENNDGDPNAYSGGHWTNATTLLTGTPTLTTSWQRFTHLTINPVSSAARSMIIEFRHTPVGTAGSNDWYEVTGIQLEIGPVATPFEHRTYTDEIQRCRRYFQKFSAYGDHHHFGVARAESNTARTGIVVHVPMRALPTIACNGHRTFRGDGGYNSESTSTPAMIYSGAGWDADSNIYTVDFPGHSLVHNRMYCLMSKTTSTTALTLDSEL